MSQFIYPRSSVCAKGSEFWTSAIRIGSAKVLRLETRSALSPFCKLFSEGSPLGEFVFEIDFWVLVSLPSSWTSFWLAELAPGSK